MKDYFPLYTDYGWKRGEEGRSSDRTSDREALGRVLLPPLPSVSLGLYDYNRND